MANNFDHCLEIILHHEGGYVNHPKDPGGETNLGVTKRVYEEHGGTKDMKDLTFEDVAPIYKKSYWDRVKGDELPAGLDLCVFDFGVNAGTGRAAKYLQNLVGTTRWSNHSSFEVQSMPMFRLKTRGNHRPTKQTVSHTTRN